MSDFPVGVNLKIMQSKIDDEKATAFAAITCSKGPPCVPGNTPESNRDDIFLVIPFIT